MDVFVVFCIVWMFAEEQVSLNRGRVMVVASGELYKAARQALLLSGPHAACGPRYLIWRAVIVLACWLWVK